MGGYFIGVRPDPERASCIDLRALARALASRREQMRTNPQRAGYREVPPLPKIDLLGSSVKVAHSLRDGWENSVMYLAPHKRAGGFDMCVMAGECKAACLTSAGQLGMIGAETAKIFKTRAYQADSTVFLNLLLLDIARFLTSIPGKEARYKSAGDISPNGSLKPTVRLNGTSDEPWEVIPFTILPETMSSLLALRKGPARDYMLKYLDRDLRNAVRNDAPLETEDRLNIFSCFPGLQFYDYTKWSIRRRKSDYASATGGQIAWPANYSLTYSLSEKAESDELAAEALALGCSVAAVFNTKVKDAEAVRKLKEGIAPESEGEASRMAKLAARKPLPEWAVIPQAVQFLGQRTLVQNADVTDLRFLDGTDSSGRGKIAWLSAKGDAIGDITGFVRDYATLAPIISAEPWTRTGLSKERIHGRPSPRLLKRLGHSAEAPAAAPFDLDRLVFQGKKQHAEDEDEKGAQESTVPYESWEEALDTGRRYIVTTQSGKRSPRTQPPLIQWNRVAAAVSRPGRFMYLGTLPEIVESVLTRSPGIWVSGYRGKRADLTFANTRTGGRVYNRVAPDVAFALASAAKARGLDLGVFGEEVFAAKSAETLAAISPRWRQEALQSRRQIIASGGLADIAARAGAAQSSLRRAGGKRRAKRG